MRIRARVWDYPTPLTDPSATNYWTLQHDDLIEDLATALGFRWLGDFERYNALLQVAMQELQTRIADDMKRLRPARQTVSPSHACREASARASARGSARTATTGNTPREVTRGEDGNRHPHHPGQRRQPLELRPRERAAGARR